MFAGFIIMPTLSAQEKKEVFKIETPGNKVFGSIYSSFRLLDLRENPHDFGKLQRGAQNKIVPVVVEVPLSEQLTQSFNTIVVSPTDDRELLFVLHQLQFAELKGRSDMGFFDFSAVLFEGKGGRYRKLKSIDTSVVITTLDATKKILRLGGKFINQLISTQLKRSSNSDITVGIEQVTLIDSLEKAKIPLYTTTRYKDGLYYNFFNFSMQHPNRVDFSVKFDKEGAINKLFLINGKGKEVAKYNDGSIYAIVYEGKPYICGVATKFYPLIKKAGDFYFKGKASDVTSDEIAAAWILFGVIGAAVVSTETSVFEMKLDHETGRFVRIRKIK